MNKQKILNLNFTVLFQKQSAIELNEKKKFGFLLELSKNTNQHWFISITENQT